MPARRGAALAIVAVLALASLGLWAWRGRSGSHALPDPPPGFDRAQSAFSPASVRGFERFPVYWVGRAFEGVPLKQILAGSGSPGTPEPAALARGPITFTYSDERDCRTVGDEGVRCAQGTDFLVETVILCRRSTRAAVPRQARMRGVPAALWGDGLLELFSGRVSIRIYTDDEGRATRLARALRAVNRPAAPAGRLPGSEPGEPRVPGVACRS
jgi:hypothetical protein